MTIPNTILATLTIAFTLAVPAHAGVIAADYLGGGTEFNFGNATGWEFILDTDVTVTGLGIYDLGAPGLTDQHSVGIFRSSDFVSLVSASIGAGTAETLVEGTVGGTRLIDVASTLLQAGVSYYILGDNWGTDKYSFGDANVSFAAGVNWTQFVDASANDIFSTPLFNGGLRGNLGPNFQFEVAPAAVPTPATLALFGLGLAGLGWSRRNRA